MFRNNLYVFLLASRTDVHNWPRGVFALSHGIPRFSPAAAGGVGVAVTVATDAGDGVAGGEVVTAGVGVCVTTAGVGVTMSI